MPSARSYSEAQYVQTLYGPKPEAKFVSLQNLKNFYKNSPYRKPNAHTSFVKIQDRSKTHFQVESKYSDSFNIFEVYFQRSDLLLRVFVPPSHTLEKAFYTSKRIICIFNTSDSGVNVYSLPSGIVFLQDFKPLFEFGGTPPINQVPSFIGFGRTLRFEDFDSENPSKHLQWLFFDKTFQFLVKHDFPHDGPKHPTDVNPPCTLR